MPVKSPQGTTLTCVAPLRSTKQIDLPADNKLADVCSLQITRILAEFTAKALRQQLSQRARTPRHRGDLVKRRRHLELPRMPKQLPQ